MANPSIASRLTDFSRRIESIADHPTLSPEGKTRALALLVTVNAGLFPKAAEALREESR